MQKDNRKDKQQKLQTKYSQSDRQSTPKHVKNNAAVKNIYIYIDQHFEDSIWMREL